MCTVHPLAVSSIRQESPGQKVLPTAKRLSNQSDNFDVIYLVTTGPKMENHNGSTIKNDKRFLAHKVKILTADGFTTTIVHEYST